MSEESLQRAEQAIDDARKAAAEAPVMPFDDGPAGATPKETGGAVAEHGNDEPENREAEQARTQIGEGSTEEGRSVNAAADAAEAEERDGGEAGGS
jgi:hypothetical protein